MFRLLFILILAGLTSLLYAQDNFSLERQKEYLDQLLPLLRPPRPDAAAVTLKDKTWFDWQARTGELPPDFEVMPSIPFLPDPLLLGEGTKNIPVTSLAQWELKRHWIGREAQHWITGTFPEAPENLTATLIEERIDPSGVKVQMVELTFGPEEKGVLTIELLLPPGKGPFPVFMTQWNHRGWAEIAVRRGYIGLVYAGADSKDDTEQYASLYPDYEFTTLMRRAWGAMRAVDYLHTLPEVDKDKIAITGHSRNGKQALMAAAFDERITAVISSSGGTAGENSFRFTDDRFDNESLDEISTNFPHWLHPRLRFFHGREHKLPIDQNLLMSLIAPRGLLLSSATTEGQGSPWGIEQNYHSLSKVYNFLGEKDKLAISLRQGRHGTMARDIEAFIDFLDQVFGRGEFPSSNQLFYNYSFEKWKEESGESIDPLKFKEQKSSEYIAFRQKSKSSQFLPLDSLRNKVKEDLKWLLGEEPPGAVAAGPFGFKRPALSDDYLGDVIQREKIGPGEKLIIGPYNALADYQYGYLHFPENKDAKADGKGEIPLVILLHEYAYSTGFGRRSAAFINQYLEAGFAVLTMDMIGFGSRIEEGELFYKRYPHWSKMGKMTADVRAALDAVQDMEMLDRSQVYLSGYALGGTVALFAAALDDRVAGVSVASAFTPLRTASQDVEGLMSYSHYHGLIPRMGFFNAHPTRLPVDFPEIISSIAPKPLLVIAPELDRHADLDRVKEGMNLVRQYYGGYKASDLFAVKYPLEVNKLSQEQQKDMIQWVKQQTKSRLDQ